MVLLALSPLTIQIRDSKVLGCVSDLAYDFFSVLRRFGGLRAWLEAVCLTALLEFVEG